MTGQKLGAGGYVRRVDIHSPAFPDPDRYLRLQSSGQQILVEPGTKRSRHSSITLKENRGAKGHQALADQRDKAVYPPEPRLRNSNGGSSPASSRRMFSRWRTTTRNPMTRVNQIVSTG